MNSIGDGIQDAVATSMKDERLKADLITNVSHDIKTPLTSIINFVKLLKREDITDERIRSYIEVWTQSLRDSSSLQTIWWRHPRSLPEIFPFSWSASILWS